MNELEQLSILKDQLDALCPKGLTSTMKYNFDNIEKELKQAEKDREMLNIFKNALTIERIEPKPTSMKIENDGSIVCPLVQNIIKIRQTELNDNLRKSLREWVLKNAFPKELKALEIIFKYITIGNPFGNVHYIYLNDESEMIMPKDFEILKEIFCNNRNHNNCKECAFQGKCDRERKIIQWDAQDAAMNDGGSLD